MILMHGRLLDLTDWSVGQDDWIVRDVDVYLPSCCGVARLASPGSSVSRWDGPRLQVLIERTLPSQAAATLHLDEDALAGAFLSGLDCCFLLPGRDYGQPLGTTRVGEDLVALLDIGQPVIEQSEHVGRDLLAQPFLAHNDVDHARLLTRRDGPDDRQQAETLLQRSLAVARDHGYRNVERHATNLLTQLDES